MRGRFSDGNSLSMVIAGVNKWGPENAWGNALRKGDEKECIGLLQIAGWELLSQYLNGGLGHEWWLFPAKLGCSDVLRDRSRLLIVRWKTFSQCFDIQSPFCSLSSDSAVESVLCRHYNVIGSFLKKYSDNTPIKISQLNNATNRHGDNFLKMISGIERLRPYLVSYWFHGSVGSGEVKSNWSDFDGLAIVSNKTFSDSGKLKKLRLGLIRLRAHMVDFMPYQLHGHFVMAEEDLISFPSCMFPVVLFENAQCVLATTQSIYLSERFDRRMALEMLWTHGVADLVAMPSIDRIDTLRKVAFLHRTFLLPCLVFQANNRPCFKKKAFEQLALIFTPEEVEVFRKACGIWFGWQSPSPLAKMLFCLAKPFRFNPLLYQFVSHAIGKKVQWFSRSPEVDWSVLVGEMRVVATNVWQRTLIDG